MKGKIMNYYHADLTPNYEISLIETMLHLKHLGIIRKDDAVTLTKGSHLYREFQLAWGLSNPHYTALAELASTVFKKGDKLAVLVSPETSYLTLQKVINIISERGVQTMPWFVDTNGTLESGWGLTEKEMIPPSLSLADIVKIREERLEERFNENSRVVTYDGSYLIEGPSFSTRTLAREIKMPDVWKGEEFKKPKNKKSLAIYEEWLDFQGAMSVEVIKQLSQRHDVVEVGSLAMFDGIIICRTNTGTFGVNCADTNDLNLATIMQINAQRAASYIRPGSWGYCVTPQKIKGNNRVVPLTALGRLVAPRPISYAYPTNPGYARF